MAEPHQPYHDEQATPAARLGQQIYHEALHPRRGFRDDQIGIPAEDVVFPSRALLSVRVDFEHSNGG